MVEEVLLCSTCRFNETLEVTSSILFIFPRNRWGNGPFLLTVIIIVVTLVYVNSS